MDNGSTDTVLLSGTVNISPSQITLTTQDVATDTLGGTVAVVGGRRDVIQPGDRRGQRVRGPQLVVAKGFRGRDVERPGARIGRRSVHTRKRLDLQPGPAQWNTDQQLLLWRALRFLADAIGLPL